MNDAFNMRSAIAKLRPDHLVCYLRSQDWETGQSRYEDRLLFLGAEHGDGRYELILPARPEVRNCRVLLQRAIYKLCGIEDRDPREILTDVFAEFERSRAVADVPAADGQLIRLRNMGSAPLTVEVSSRSNDYQLMPREAVEIALPASEGGVPEIEYSDNKIVIKDTKTT